MRLILFFLLITMFGCDESRNYEVVITYITGETDTIFMSSIVPPKLENSGCVYDYSERTYRCGVRKVFVQETPPTPHR